LLLGHLPWHIHVTNIIITITNLLKSISHATVILTSISIGIVMDTIGGDMARNIMSIIIVPDPFLNFTYTNGVVER
jgi:hypothetical protein